MQLNSRLSEQEHNVHPVYRPDIDGLRAVAILSVVVFHAFPTHLRGGFVGVDIFFVISGFLISNIIFRSLQRGDFSFTEFYAHRIKRIFPALILVLATSFALGWFTLLPDEFKQLGKHMAAGAGFVQNFVLWKEAGYFDTASELKPLMHLWSLAIEEQFYLIYPLLIWAAWRFRLNALAVLIVLAALSFGLNVLEIRGEAVKTFFVPQTRYWELLAGAVLAYLQLFRRTQPAAGEGQDATSPVLIGQTASSAHRRRVRNNLQSACGLFLILVAAIAIHKGKAFPGWWALAPVMGAFLLILAGPQAWVNRNLLANRLMVFVGVISYPLYLWHWPILSFARIVEAEMPSPEIRGAAVAFSFLLAWLTYRLLERPIRFGRKTWVKTALLSCLLTLVGSVGYVAYQRDGLGFRFEKLAPEYAKEVLKISEAWKFRDYPQPEASYVDGKYGFLTLGQGKEHRILFVGDSHAQQYWNTAAAALQKDPSANTSVMFADLGVPPKLDQQIMADPAIDAVVFSYYWAYKYGSDKVNQPMRCCGPGRGGVMGFYNLPLHSPEQMDQIDSDLKNTVDSLKNAGKKVYFVLDNPFGEELDPHSKVTRSIWHGIRISVPPPLTREMAIDRAEPVRSRILKIARETASIVIDPIQFLCGEDVCPAFSEDGELLYKDYDHLSLNASLHHARYLDAIFDRNAWSGAKDKNHGANDRP